MIEFFCMLSFLWLVFRYFGGKWVFVFWIIEQFPPHWIYVEPYGGGVLVLMRKPRSYAEVYNDLDAEIVNVFRVLRNRVLSVELERALRLTPFARAEFEDSYLPTSSPVEGARRTIVRSVMGFGSNANNSEERTGFRANSNRSNTTAAGDWKNYPDCLRAFVARLQGVVIESRRAVDVMSQQDSRETLHFVDPFYVRSTRSEKHGYRYEMADQEHETLCDFLQTLEGMVILCGYENPIYDRLGWETHKHKARTNNARNHVEILWLNPTCMATQTQGRLL